MDLQKEREAFEAWLFKYYPKAKELGIVYRPNENLYEDRQTQIRWIVWQAAIAQAVPEGKGFVLVSQKELMELAIAINAVDLATHTEEKPNEVREMWQQVALKLSALCSTGAN